MNAGTVRSTPVIVLTWNGWEDALDCLQALTADPEVETVWLVDNGSDLDHSADARAVFPGLRVIRHNENFGWAGGYNRVLKRAAQSGISYAYLLNDDTRPEPGFLSAVLELAHTDANLAAVGSYVLHDAAPEWVMFDGEFHPIGQRRALRGIPPHAVKSVSGTGMLVNLGALESVGYFDERYFCYVEETEWCLRASDRGWRLAMAPTSVITHRNQGSDVSANAIYYTTRNHLFLSARLQRWQRSREIARQTYLAVRGASAARRRGESLASRAVSAGLWDGLMGRGGKRDRPPPRLVHELVSRGWPFAPGAFTKYATRTTAIRRPAASNSDVASPPPRSQLSAGESVKIVLLSHTAEPGGAESCLVQAVQVLVTHGYATRVILPRAGPLGSVLQLHGASVTIIPFRWWMHVDQMKRPVYYRMRRLALEAVAQVRLGLLLRRERPNLVMSSTMTIVTGALAAWLARVPHVWYLHEFGSKSHGWSFDYGARFSFWVMNRLSNSIVVNSRTTREHLSVHLPPHKLHVLYAPVSAPSATAGPERSSEGPLRLVCVGSLLPGKRQEDAVRAIGLLRAQGYDVRIAFYGREHGSYGSFLRTLVNDLHLNDAVAFCGYSVTPWAAAAEASVMCSVDEAFGLSTVEAMMAGMPVVGAASGATPELIQDGWNGLLFPPGDAAGLASKIAVLYQDRALLKTMGTNARAWAEATFRRDRYERDLLSLLQSVLGRWNEVQ